jgi:hypothetical protein
MAHVDRSIKYILEENGDIFMSSRVPQTEGRRARVIEMLCKIERKFPESDIAEYCHEKVVEICRGNPFEQSKLLLLSQCDQWVEENGKYALSLKPNYDKTNVTEAVGKLVRMKREGDGNDSERDPRLENLLEAIKNSPIMWNLPKVFSF